MAFCQQKKILDSLHYKLETTRDDSVRVYTLVELSREYAYSNINLSLEYAEKSLLLAEKTSSKRLVTYAVFNLGIVYFELGAYEISAKYFYRYLDIKKESGNPMEIAYAMTNIGAIRTQLKQYDLAEEMFLESLNILNNYRDSLDLENPFPEIISIYNNLGVIYKEKEDTLKAVEYYSKGIIIARKLAPQDKNLSNLLNNLGSSYVDLDKFEEAYDLLNEALEMRLEFGDKTGMASSYRNLGNYFHKNGDDKSAVLFYQKALTLALESGVNTLTSSVLKKYYEFYNDKSNADSALKYHLMLYEYNEKINKEETMKELTQLELTSQFHEKEKIRMVEQKRKEQLYLTLGLFLIMMAAIAGLLYFLALSRIRRLNLEKVNDALSAKNLLLEKEQLENELELANKEMATNVIYQIQKNELVNDIVQKLLKHSPNFKKENQDLIRSIIADLEKTQKKTVWDEFELRFQSVHSDFYTKLNEINPELTLNERRICAFLRLNMTTKEIATITGQMPRSIDVARTRLRKKLNLTNEDVGLVEFLSSI
jgi:tetratricopeptide (TPR) repeat protein/DNA-binding CsgD family transcriptional regulator